MDANDTVCLLFNVSTNDSCFFNNQTGTLEPIYLFTPAGDTAKLVLCPAMLSIGAMGLLGNCLIFYFLWKKPTANPIQSSHFVKNLNLYVRSLSLSDCQTVCLSCAISLPLLCIQISLDVFQGGWACRIV